MLAFICIVMFGVGFLFGMKFAWWYPGSPGGGAQGSQVMYDPPAGWLYYGFPKRYRPLPGESLEDTLRRDGYPEKELERGMAEYCKFWEEPEND